MQNHIGRKVMFGVVATALVALSLAACSSSEEKRVEGLEVPTEELLRFERVYSQSLSLDSRDAVRLIGYKKVALDSVELAQFGPIYDQNRDKLKNYYLDRASATLRIYFPVEGALVEHRGSVTEASAQGELDRTRKDMVEDPEMAVLGRRQTDNIRGVEGNVIKDGIIYLAERNRPTHSFDNVYVFDFGVKVIHDHGAHDHVVGGGSSGDVNAKASCMSNHGGPNCSNKYGIYQGRCSFNSRVCMDYNGWFTDCVNGKTLNFPGSDCAAALAAGHCWNEVM